MDESVVPVINGEEDKMEENDALKPVLEVSVSFGRFENDLLSWEKWSTFSPNKYLEEVEKYATPGSVAQKRAYFEAHYKKIADRKTKLLEQETIMEGDATVPNELNCGDLLGNYGKDDSESDSSNHRVWTEEVEQDSIFIGEVSSIYREVVKGDEVVKNDTETTMKCESLPASEKEELNGNLDAIGSETNRHDAVDMKRVETPPIESKSTKEPPQKLVTKISRPSKIKAEVKSNQPKESKKVTPVAKERTIASIKKKQVSSTAKAPQISTPKLSKTTPPSITHAPRSPAPRFSASRGNTFSLSRSQNQPGGEGRKVAPKSLHMSISLGTPNSDPSSVTSVRRSFIMEKMGDKDIVKRAFKTFQNSFNQMKSSPNPAEERSTVPKMVPAKAKETKISTSVTARKENGGLRKEIGADSRFARVAPSQKLEGKVQAKVVGRTNIQSKSKVPPSQKSEKFNPGEGTRKSLQSKQKEVAMNGLRR